jgi:hypothetical protein
MGHSTMMGEELVWSDWCGVADCAGLFMHVESCMVMPCTLLNWLKAWHGVLLTSCQLCVVCVSARVGNDLVRADCQVVSVLF